MPITGFLITGTDTGVGKTISTAALAVGLQLQGVRVGIMKPAETGCPVSAGETAPQDALFLQRIADLKAPIELICPYRFQAPVAPLVAAEFENSVIDQEHLTRCWQQLAAQADVMLVEGAGGLAVPLGENLDFAGLAALWQLAVIVVIDNRLGCISHARLTISYAERAGLRVAGYVVNHSSSRRDAAAASNPHTLARLLDAPCLGILPYLPELTTHREERPQKQAAGLPEPAPSTAKASLVGLARKLNLASLGEYPARSHRK